ncbi:MAG: hypothetical protein ACI8P0_003564, partial [Planctomycetaceae bacterium]
MVDSSSVRFSWPFTIAFLAVISLSGGRSLYAESVIVNAESTTYDYHPSSAATDSGSVWLAWHGYRQSRDQIFARYLDSSGELGQTTALSGEGAVHGPPTIVASSDGSVSAVWSSKIAGRWRVVLRQRIGEEWQPGITLSDSQNDAVFPTIAHGQDGGLLAAWSEHTGGHWRIQACPVNGGKPAAAFNVSAGGIDAFRPVIAEHDRQQWVFWDQYDRPNYAIVGRVVALELGEIERVSPPGEYCLTPTALSHENGLHVAWLRKIDVVGGPGVISQWHTLHAAVKGQGEWRQIETAEGSTIAAELTQGLMAQIEPRPVATGGYLGPRVRPQLMADGDRVWLLWERKSNHRGSTPSVSGDLVGRPSVDGRWQKPVILKQGYVDYHVVDRPSSRKGELQILASHLPKRGLRRYELFDVELDEATPFQQDDWTGWEPVELPIAEESMPRREVSIDGKKYKLFWGDLHCHNGLTADAEGQPDEMHHYARDRAGLDVVVFTNNDFYNVPLTQYDFELGNLFAAKFSARPRDGRRGLLSLPGFEWTSRIPGVSTATLADSSNWLPPY